MTNYSFHPDLDRAKNTELEVSKLIQTHYGMKTLKIGKTYEYDLLVRANNLRLFSLEVKEDFRAGETGNFLLEFEFKGKPSGISVSKADFYIHKFHLRSGIEYWSTASSILRQMIEDKLYFMIREGGDGSKDGEKVTGIRDATMTTKNYLFKMKVFKQHSKQLFLEKVKVEI